MTHDIHAHTYTKTHSHTLTYFYIHPYIHIHAYTHVHTGAAFALLSRLYRDAPTGNFFHSVCSHTQTYTHICRHAHIQTHMHTHTHEQVIMGGQIFARMSPDQVFALHIQNRHLFFCHTATETHAHTHAHVHMNPESRVGGRAASAGVVRGLLRRWR